MKIFFGTKDVTQRLKALVTLSEDWDLNPSPPHTHMEANDCSSIARGSNTLSWSL